MRAGQGEGRCTVTHIQGHRKKRLEDKRPSRKVRAQHAQSDFDSQPCETTSSTAQPAADSPALRPCVKHCSQGAPGAMPSPTSAVSPLMCPAEAVPVGAAATSPWGSQQPTIPCSPVGSTGEMHFQRVWGLSRQPFAGQREWLESLQKWLFPALPTEEQQRWLACPCA